MIPSSVVKLIILSLSLLHTCHSQQVTENSLKMFKKVYSQCAAKNDVIKCLKINALKVVDRALHSKALQITNGITLVMSGDNRDARSFHLTNNNSSKLEALNGDQLNGMIFDTAARFLDTHKLKINMTDLVEEGRKKKDKQGHAALLWALAIKGSFLAMAYKGIAIMAGTALIVGKMALLLSAILGLKKLVSSGHEKTTFEIVKHPKYSESHTHSTSYEDEGHYHRSFDTLDRGYGLKMTYKPKM